MKSVLLIAAVAACTTPGMSTTAGPDAAGTGHDGAPNTTDAPPPPPITHAISVIVEPDGNHGSQLATAIAAAQHAVYMTMYELDSQPIINALVARKAAGLDVQVILDGSNSTKSFNMPAYTALANANIAVVWSNTAFTYTHEKTVMIDGKTAWIMTMNLNTSSPSDNREYLAIDTEPSDVFEAIQVFQADHAHTAITPTGNLVVADVNARQKLVALIDSATTTLDVEGEEFSDNYSTGIVRAVERAASRGVTVHVIIGNSPPFNTTAVNGVKSVGAHVVVTGPSSGNGTPSNPYIHAKAILVDCAGTTCVRGFVGSENFSTGSLSYNRELGVVFDTASELAKMKTAIDLDYSRGVAQ